MSQNAITLSVQGMTCQHCERRVKKAIEALAGEGAAQVSAAESRAVVAPANPVDPAALAEAVTKAGYPATVAAR